MKKQFLYSIFIISLSVFGHARAQTYFTKEVSQQFPMSQEGVLRMTNKYGDIEVTGWDKDSVALSVHIRVSDDSDDILDRINPQIEYSNNTLDITTEVNEKKKSSFMKFIRKYYPLDRKKNNVKVDYQLKVPRELHLKLSNKYGDVRIEDYEGDMELYQEHGDIRVESNVGDVKVYLKYGHLQMKHLRQGDIHLQNSTLSCKSATILKLTSSGSRLEVNEVEEMQMISSKDDMYLNRVGSLDMELKFSNVVIDKVQSGSLTMHHSDLRIDQIESPDGGELTIDERNSEVRLDVSQMNVQISALMEGGEFKLLEENESVTVELIDEEKELRKIDLIYGSMPKYSLKIKAKKGTILIK